MPYSSSEAIVFLIFMTIFIIVMVTFIIIILFFVQKKQRGFTNELLEVKANHDRELYKAELETQEQTCQDVARELHDNVGQLLSLAKLGLCTLDLERRDEAKQSIAEISDILEKAMDHLRHITRTMNADVIKKGGLKKSIEMQVGYIQRGGKYNIHFNVKGDSVMLPETKEIILFRIAQEAINNIIRHSCATDIYISLGYNKNSLELHIRDNGKGFILNENASGTDHISGIYNMRHRAKLIDAEFHIESRIGNGTSIIVTTPY